MSYVHPNKRREQESLERYHERLRVNGLGEASLRKGNVLWDSNTKGTAKKGIDQKEAARLLENRVRRHADDFVNRHEERKALKRKRMGYED